MNMHFAKYFQQEMFICKICGAWFYIYDSKLDYLYYLYWLICNVSFGVYIIMKILYVMEFKDIYGIVGSSFILPIAITGYVRSYSFFKYRREFKELLATLDDEIFQPKDQNEQKMFEKTIKFYSFYKKVLYIWSGVTSTGCQMGKIVFGVSDSPDDGQEHCEAAVSTKHGWFIYFFQTYSMSMLLVLNLISDLFMVGFCLFLSMQCERLSYQLENLEKCTSAEIRRVTNVYKRILRFSQKNQTLFGTIYFTYYFACLFACATTLVMFSITVPLSFRFFHMLEYLGAIFGMLFTPCWFGTQVTKKSEQIRFAAYSARWIDAEKSDKKDLQVFMQMVDSPIEFKAWKLLPLTLESYMTVVKTSFSYYTVLTNLIQK